jgi:hypothetical protein
MMNSLGSVPQHTVQWALEALACGWGDASQQFLAEHSF